MNCVLYHDPEGVKAREFIKQFEWHYDDERCRRRNIFKFNILLTAYHLITSDWEELKSIHWRYVVVDEAHRLKNREGQLLQVCVINL